MFGHMDNTEQNCYNNGTTGMTEVTSLTWMPKTFWTRGRLTRFLTELSVVSGGLRHCMDFAQFLDDWVASHSLSMEDRSCDIGGQIWICSHNCCLCLKPSDVSGFLDISPAVHWLLIEDIDPFNAVLGFCLAFTDIWWLKLGNTADVTKPETLL